MNNERKQAAKNFLTMLLEQNIPLRDGNEEDRIVICLGLVLMLDLDEETKELVIKLKDKYSQQEIDEGLKKEFNPYVLGLLSNFDPSILESTRSDSPTNIQDINVGEL
tara:strand:- start:442 stop:765 length:324 start_codon:yes stop_codon:yes gene_type:complete